MSARTDMLTLHYLTKDEPAFGRHLLRQYGTATATLDASPEIQHGETWPTSLRADADAYGAIAARRAASVGATLLIDGDDDWPAALGHLGDNAPLALYVRGRVAALNQWADALALCGARASTAYGAHVAGTIAGLAADNGVAIITGGAYGIAAAAMRAHLAVGGAPQIVVLPGGVERHYPAAHHDLFESVIAQHGAVISEFPTGSAPHRTRFLARNRLIATAKATVIVEAASRSGALSTARHAAALKRPIGAVPGAITSATSAGCHRLISDGLATLIHDPHDALALLAPQPPEDH